jgi:hypothetical protein
LSGGGEEIGTWEFNVARFVPDLDMQIINGLSRKWERPDIFMRRSGRKGTRD